MITYEKHRSAINYLYRQYDENLQFHSHFHESFELIYVYEGEISVVIEKEIYTIKKGQCLLIMPNQIHSYFTKKYSKTFILIFAYSYVATFYKYSLLYCSKKPYFNLENEERILEVLQSDENIYLQKSILYYLVFLYSSGESVPRDNKYNTLMQRVLIYVDKNYHQKLTLKNLSTELGYDYHYLSGVINEGFGSNFLSYVNEYRINKICEIMMNDTQTPINELAYNVGYSSLRTFNRNFVKYKKMTPFEYRKKLIHEK